MITIKRRIKQAYVIVAMLTAFLYTKIFNHKYKRQNIWLVGEKQAEARDNGYHFFKYLNQEHPEINSVYVIKKGSYDYNKVSDLGETIYYNSFKHLCYYISAKFLICSQVYGAQPFVNILSGKHIKIFNRKDQNHIFIGHGIHKDKNDSYDYKKSGVDLMTCGAKIEYEYLKNIYQYPDSKIALTGLCRFDSLHSIEKNEKIVLVMPTFRSWLRASDSRKNDVTEKEREMFRESEYFKKYSELLNNKKLKDALDTKGYKLIFYLHYTFQPYCKLFKHMNSKNIIIADRANYDVQDLLIRCSMLVTDYSGVAFDVGYQKKPVVYYQFDEEEYRSNHYSEGFFSYENHGFGPVVRTLEDLVSFIEYSLSHACNLDEKYEKRILDFFAPYDDNNCERLYRILNERSK